MNRKLAEGQHTDRINLHVARDMKLEIMALAKGRGVTMNEMVRVLLKKSLNRRG